MLPFTRDEFMSVFAQYHEGTWPAVIVWYITAVLLLAYQAYQQKTSAQLVLLYLGLLWSWTGAVYMWGYFSAINPAASSFSVLFLGQGLWLIYESRKRVIVDLRSITRWGRYVSYFLFFYALVAYPFIGSLTGHTYPAAPLFGLPCPNTIFTFAALLLVTNESGHPVKRLFVIPVLWSVVATVAAIELGVVQDWMLPVAAISSMLILYMRALRTRHSKTPSVIGV
jgi:hypothetical protein